MPEEKALGAKSCAKTGSCCKVESVISVGQRGQVVLPKEVRERAGIEAGDKLTVVSWENEGEVCCITLMKVEYLTPVARGVLAQ
jgi:antitoxin PrlF